MRPASSNAVPCVRSHCVWITGAILNKQAETHTFLYFLITILHGRGWIWIPTCPLSCPSSLKLSATEGWSSWKVVSDGELCFQLRIGLLVEFVVPLVPILDELGPFWMLGSCQASCCRPHFPILVSEIHFERKASPLTQGRSLGGSEIRSNIRTNSITASWSPGWEVSEGFWLYNTTRHFHSLR